jgi:serine/threonine protein kinase
VGLALWHGSCVWPLATHAGDVSVALEVISVQATIRIKGYDRFEQIAMGRRAVVFKGHDRASRRPVAFKVLFPHLVEDPRFLRRFKRDVQIASQINHASIVNALQYGRADDSYFVAFEYYDGFHLEEILSDHPRVPVDVALCVLYGVAQGLEACHAKRIVHRDVQPRNIVLTRTKGAKLANLSLATDIAQNGRIMHAGRLVVTPAYMSPEQTRGESLGIQSDIFSLGAVAYELMSGRRAFGRGEFGEIVESVQSVTPRPVAELNPIIEPVFGEIIGRMLEKDRTRRYANFGEVLAELEVAMNNYGYDRDIKPITRFVADPAEYVKWYTQRLLEKLAATAPIGTGTAAASAPAAIRHYEKLVYLNPADEDAQGMLARLKLDYEKAGDDSPSRVSELDPDSLYRVVLQSIGAPQEGESSFALKLSMKLKISLPAAQMLVSAVPTALPGEYPYRKARFVASVMEDLGATVRIDLREPDGGSSQLCPECGSKEDAGAELCSFCGHSFRRLVQLQPGLGGFDKDPFVEPSGYTNNVRGLLNRINDLPTNMKALGVLGIVLAFILLRFL